MPMIIGRRELIAALGGAAVWPLSHTWAGESTRLGILSAGNEHAIIPPVQLFRGSAGVGMG